MIALMEILKGLVDHTRFQARMPDLPILNHSHMGDLFLKRTHKDQVLILKMIFFDILRAKGFLVLGVFWECNTFHFPKITLNKR